MTTSPALDALWIRARVVPACGGETAIERIGPLTPYLTQTIVEDALASGRGSTVQIEFHGTGTAQVLQVRRRVQLLTGRGIRVAVRTRAEPRPGRRRATGHASRMHAVR